MGRLMIMMITKKNIIVEQIIIKNKAVVFVIVLVRVRDKYPYQVRRNSNDIIIML